MEIVSLEPENTTTFSNTLELIENFVPQLKIVSQIKEYPTENEIQLDFAL